MMDPIELRQADAARTLANLLGRALDHAIDAEKLEKFIRDQWNSVRILAHSIHGSEAEPAATPNFPAGTKVESYPAFVVDSNGQGWWVDPQMQKITRA